MSTPIVLYGAGQLGSLFLQLCKPLNLTILAILDRYTDQAELGGVPVYRPYDAPDHLLTATVVVCAFKSTEPQSIYNDLKILGYSNVTDAYKYLFSLRGSAFFNGWRIPLIDQNSRRKRMSCFLADYIHCEHSRSLYLLNLKYRQGLTDNLGFLDMLSPESCKYSNDIVKCFLKEFSPSLVLDVGSWDMTLLRQLKEITPPPFFSRYIAFDPLDEAFEHFSSSLPTLKTIAGSAEIVRSAAVGLNCTATGRVPFHSGMGMASRVVSPHNRLAVWVNACTLSDYVTSCSIVKLHIEGKEYPVVKEFLLKASRDFPHLLIINCSHTPEGLFEIPYVLAQHGCELHYLQHAFYGEGLTLYALLPAAPGLRKDVNPVFSTPGRLRT